MAQKKTTKARGQSDKRERPVLVTTQHRGVFFGFTSDGDGERVTLKRCRNVLYWAQECKGFLGLTNTGPIGASRIGPEAPEVQLRNITSVSEMTAAAALCSAHSSRRV